MHESLAVCPLRMGLTVEAIIMDETVAALHVPTSGRKNMAMYGRVMVAPHQYVRLLGVSQVPNHPRVSFRVKPTRIHRNSEYIACTSVLSDIIEVARSPCRRDDWGTDELIRR